MIDAQSSARLERASLTCRGALLSLALVGTMASQAQAQPSPTSPQDFVSAAAGSDQYEIFAARVALAESHNPGVRGFAERMVREHEAALAVLRQAATRAGLKPPSDSLGADEARLLAALQGLRGAAFDREYKTQQVLAHVQALTTERDYATGGSNLDLRVVAAADVPMIQSHLRSAEALK